MISDGPDRRKQLTFATSAPVAAHVTQRDVIAAQLHEDDLGNVGSDPFSLFDAEKPTTKQR